MPSIITSTVVAKIDEVLLSENPEPHEPYIHGPMKPLLVSLYGQKDRHMYMQKVILGKQQKALEDSKEQPYVASIRERKTELALLDAHKREKLRIERAYQEQTELYDSLDDKLNEEGDVHVSTASSEAQWYGSHF